MDPNKPLARVQPTLAGTRAFILPGNDENGMAIFYICPFQKKSNPYIDSSCQNLNV
jgi:hypothetical protein